MISAVAAVLLLGLSGAHAKPPTLTDVFPPGAARGQSAVVRVSGTFDHWPAKVWIEGPGVAIQAEKEKGRLKVDVAADAAPGLRWMRLYDEEGATSLRPFVIGILPEAVESEPNDEPRSAHRLNNSSTVVNGRLARPGDVDGFRVELNRGQTLVADLEAARQLGSPMDAVLQVVSLDGSVLAQNDDDVGRDPRIIFEAPSKGPYIVRLFAFPATPDSTIRFAGDNTFVYRLTLTTRGFIDYAFPLAVGRDGPRSHRGERLEHPRRGTRLAPSDKDECDIFGVYHPLLAGTTEVRHVAYAATIETEPNDLARPQAIKGPVALSGRIDPPGDVDVFRLSLRKGEKRLTSRRVSRARQAARSDASRPRRRG